MKIAIISDIHDNVRMLTECVDYLNSQNIDLMINCGDWVTPFVMRVLAKAKFPVKSVLGNGDPDIQKFEFQIQNLEVLKNVKLDIQTEIQDFTIDGKRVCVFHGDDAQVINLVLESQLYDLFCLGHTHEYGICKEGKTLVVNPGSFVGFMYEKGLQPIYTVIYDTATAETITVDLEKI